jgi:hypothetical protein
MDAAMHVQSRQPPDDAGGCICGSNTVPEWFVAEFKLPHCSEDQAQKKAVAGPDLELLPQKSRT